MLPSSAAAALRALVLAAVLPWAASAAGQPAVVAEQLFQEGQALLEQGQVDEACAKFEASMQTDASAGTALNLARCNELRGKTATAWAGFKQAASLFRARGDADRERFARERATDLASRLSKLVIVAPQLSGLAVRQDGVSVPPAALGTAVPVDPGEHRIEAKAAGYEPWFGSVTVGPDGDSQRLTIPPLRALPTGGAGEGGAGDAEPEPGGGDGLVIGGVVLAGVGAAALIVGSVLGGLVLSDASSAENDDELCGSDKLCTPEGLDQIDSAETKALAADVLLVSGAAFVVGGVVLLLVGTSGDDEASGSSRPASAWLAPVPYGSGALVGCSGSF